MKFPLDIKRKFIQSAFSSEDEALYSTEYINQWITERKEETFVEVNQVAISELKNWRRDSTHGSIHHISNKFFSIEGITVNTNFGIKSTWDQPIVNQPEIGFLGIITKEINGVLHFLIQAKIEPGNINIVQLSPTLQATRSNYTRMHKGKAPQYLEYFNGGKANSVLIDQFQSEQGARFLKKRNRNIIIEVDPGEEMEIYSNFIWMTLRQLNQFMRQDNLINMDTRTVISSVFFYLTSDEQGNANSIFGEYKNDSNGLLELIDNDTPLMSTGHILSWITSLKFKYELNVTMKSLNNLSGWNYSDHTVSQEDGNYFSVIGVNVNIENREVISWDQPMIKPAHEGILAFIVKKVEDTYHFLVQAKVEAGNFDILELAPTVQCLTGNYRIGYNEYSVPFINEVLNAPAEKVWHRSYQSEEGGRFYQEQNLNLIVEVDESFPIEIPDNYCWMTLTQLNNFMRFNNYLNIGARSLISLISI